MTGRVQETGFVHQNGAFVDAGKRNLLYLREVRASDAKYGDVVAASGQQRYKSGQNNAIWVKRKNI